MKGESNGKCAYSENLFYGENEKISDIQVEFEFINGQKQKLSKNEIGEGSSLTTNFYSGKRKKIIPFPQNNMPYKFSISYTKTTNEISFLCILPMTDYNADSIYYEINLPSTHFLHFTKNDIDEIQLHLNSKYNPTIHSYSFSTKRKSERNCSILHKDDSHEYPMILCMVTANEFRGKEFDFLANEYFRLLVNIPKLSDEYMHDFNFNEEKNELERIKKIFNTVRKRVSYVDFENGIGALQPRNPNDIWIKKQGDCKDMAFLIHEILDYNHIENYVALSSSISHFRDLDFASNCTSNHAVCVAVVKKDTLLLDATQDIGQWNIPSAQTQGRNVLLIKNGNGGKLYKVPSLSIKKNYERIISSYSVQDNNVSAETTISLYGNTLFKPLYASKNLNEKDKISFITKIARSYFSKLIIDSTLLLKATDTVCTYLQNRTLANL